MPVLDLSKRFLEPRATVRCYYRYGRQICRRESPWSRFGRWILLGVILFFLVIFLLCLMMSRRRMKRGTKPIYGTGWTGGRNVKPQQTQMQSSQPQYPNQEYYGGGAPYEVPGNNQTHGVTQPPPTYYNNQAQPQYQPPPGPPPGR